MATEKRLRLLAVLSFFFCFLNNPYYLFNILSPDLSYICPDFGLLFVPYTTFRHLSSGYFPLWKAFEAVQQSMDNLQQFKADFSFARFIEQCHFAVTDF